MISPDVGVTSWTGAGPKDSEAAKAAITKGSAVAGDIGKLKLGEKVRFSGSLIPTKGSRCFQSLAHPTDLFAPAFYVQLRSVHRTSEGPTLAMRPPPGATPSAAAETAMSDEERIRHCEKDWAACADNAELIEHYGKMSAISVACERAGERAARYGTPKWGAGWLSRSFATYWKGASYIRTGVANIIDKEVQFQNGFGAWVNSIAYCSYDLRKGEVVDFHVEPR